MITYKFIKENGEIKNFDLIVAKLRSRVRFLMNGNYELSVKKIVHKRTLPQNRLYRLWLNIIAEETGNDTETLHEFFKQKFITPEYTDFGSIKIEKTKTTTTLTTDEFTIYLREIEAFVASELGITLPHPEDKDFETLINN